MGTSSNLEVRFNGRTQILHASYDGYAPETMGAIAASVASYGLDALRTAMRQQQVVDEDDADDGMVTTVIQKALTVAKARGRTAFGVESFVLDPSDLWNFKHPYVGLAPLLATQLPDQSGWGTGDFVVDLDAGTVMDYNGVRIDLTALDAWDPDALAAAISETYQAQMSGLHSDQPATVAAAQALNQSIAQLTPIPPQAPTAGGLPLAAEPVDVTAAFAPLAESELPQSGAWGTYGTKGGAMTVVFPEQGLGFARVMEALLRKWVAAGELPQTVADQVFSAALQSQQDDDPYVVGMSLTGNTGAPAFLALEPLGESLLGFGAYISTDSGGSSSHMSPHGRSASASGTDEPIPTMDELVDGFPCQLETLRLLRTREAALADYRTNVVQQPDMAEAYTNTLFIQAVGALDPFLWQALPQDFQPSEDVMPWVQMALRMGLVVEQRRMHKPTGARVPEQIQAFFQSTAGDARMTAILNQLPSDVEALLNRALRASNTTSQRRPSP